VVSAPLRDQLLDELAAAAAWDRFPMELDR
jgi:hypothetical protein